VPRRHQHRLSKPILSLAFVAAFALAPAARADEGEGRAAERAQMVKKQIEARGVKNQRVLEAMRTIPREWFVPKELAHKAYSDHPLAIGHEQTISQPYIVAAMTELLDPKPEQKVLEVGTGSGYQAAVLSKLVREVHTIEIVPELAKRAGDVLREHGFGNVYVRAGDGYRGIPGEAPFDGIIVTAAPEQIPTPLIEQLKIGGRMVIPVGARSKHQVLKVLERTKDGVETREVFDVSFVPMTGEVERKK
jgi:protein-L-isoaspartate(D-aspartate) O-methyltransferase